MPDTTPQAVQACHDILAWVIPKLDTFPRNRRFTLGDRIETGLLDVLELLIQAAYSRNKTQFLVQANNRLNVVRHLWRLALELRVINPKSYEYGAGLLVDLGRQIGGWRKASR